MKKPEKIYFASDFHLGAPDYEKSLVREKMIVRWLNEIEKDATHLYLMGDLFDFWFEYRNVVPKGFVRFLGKLAEMADRGIKLHIFTGNHDLWLREYLSTELNAKIYKQPQIEKFGDKTFYLAHGDGLGPGDHGFKIMKKVFVNPFSQWLFRRLHPDSGVGLANYFSRTSRAHTGEKDSKFLGEDKEWLVLHSKAIMKEQHIDYFVYGHRHFPMELDLGQGSTYVNLGDWIKYFTYAVWDGEKLALKYYEA